MREVTEETRAPGEGMPGPSFEPLSAAELEMVVEVLRQGGAAPAGVRFVHVCLAEPAKESLSNPDGLPDRLAEAVLLDRHTGRIRRAVVSLRRRSVESMTEIPAAQPPILIEEFTSAATAIRTDERWRAAMRRRGITDFDAVQIDPWVTGNFGLPFEQDRRILRGVSYLRADPSDNGYAHPIEGVIAFVDLNDNSVVHIEDHGIVAVPDEDGRYDADHAGPVRDDLKPLEVNQPDGPSYTVRGHQVDWQRWSFGVSLHPTEGLVLHRIGYRDGDRLRPILHRAALAEMVVPYGETSPMHAWKNAFDAGEYGLGRLTNELVLGCDCLGEIHYFDAAMVGDDGTTHTLRNAICMHEEDYGILWKHHDLHTGTTEVRRSRRLVVSAVHTVGNYEYGFYWYFYLDGTIQVEIKLTGILQTMAVEPGSAPRFSSLIAERLAAPLHQHLFNFRLDFELDGPANSVYEVDVVPEPPGPRNPLGNAFTTEKTLLVSESQAQRCADETRSRFWTVTNPSSLNRLREPVGYKIILHGSSRLLASQHSSIAKRAAFATRNLWVTPYDPDERHPAGDFPNQHPGGDGLASWAESDRPVHDADIVVWLTCGVTHVPRPEDWPVMPIEYTGFSLAPAGFFDRNPALDVPPPAGAHCHAALSSSTNAGIDVRPSEEVKRT